MTNVPNQEIQHSEEYQHSVVSIKEVLNRYARGIDRKDWDLVRATYHDNAEIHQGNYRGGVAGLVENLKQRQVGIDQSMHVIGNVIVEFAEPGVALSEAYWIAFQELGPAAGTSRQLLVSSPVGETETVSLQVYGRWIDEFTDEHVGWRVARRTVVIEGTATRVNSSAGGASTGWARPSRDRDDPLYIARRRLRLSN